MKVGDSVICVDGDFSAQMNENAQFFEVFHNLPKQYSTYTLREVESTRVLLEEVVNPEAPFNLAGVTIWTEPGFDIKRFRPLNEFFGITEEEDSKEGLQTIESPQVEEYTLDLNA